MSSNGARFWMVWDPNKQAPKVKHPTLDKARKEAERLAARHFGFKPSDWCLKGSAFELEAYREGVEGG